MIEALRRDQVTDRKITRITISPHTFNQRLTIIRQFISWCFDMHLSSLPLSDQSYERIREQQKRLLKWLDSSFINAPPSNTLDVPSLLIIGDVGSVVTAEVAAKLAGLNQHLETIQIVEAGHALPYDQPERFSTVVKTFLRSVST